VREKLLLARPFYFTDIFSYTVFYAVCYDIEAKVGVYEFMPKRQAACRSKFPIPRSRIQDFITTVLIK